MCHYYLLQVGCHLLYHQCSCNLASLSYVHTAVFIPLLGIVSFLNSILVALVTYYILSRNYILSTQNLNK
jgi:hypothetical protein